MSHDIEVSTRTRGDVSIIEIKGDLTTVTGERVEAVYQQMSAEGSKKFVLFFDKDCYINSGGIATLIEMVSESIDREQVLRIAGLSDHFQKIFAMVGLTRYAAIFASEEAALEGF
jgi:anti-anti-sigma factor